MSGMLLKVLETHLEVSETPTDMSGTFTKVLGTFSMSHPCVKEMSETLSCYVGVLGKDLCIEWNIKKKPLQCRQKVTL